jgi:hypothetical protein
LCPAFSKVFEKVMYTRLYQHLSQNNILLNEKQGFRNNSSTEMASYELLNSILLVINNKLTVGVYFVTWRKLSVVLTIISYYQNWTSMG